MGGGGGGGGGGGQISRTCSLEEHVRIVSLAPTLHGRNLKTDSV